MASTLFTEPNGHPVVETETAWLPIPSIPAPPELAGQSDPPAAAAPVARRRSRKRLAAFSAAGVVVMAGLGFGVMSDIGVRQSQSATASDLAVTKAKLQAASAALIRQGSQIDDLHQTVSAQQQQIDGANAQNKALTTCIGDVKGFISDLANNDMNAATAAYNKAYTACGSAGATLPS